MSDQIKVGDRVRHLASDDLFLVVEIDRNIVAKVVECMPRRTANFALEMLTLAGSAPAEPAPATDAEQSSMEEMEKVLRMVQVQLRGSLTVDAYEVISAVIALLREVPVLRERVRELEWECQQRLRELAEMDAAVAARQQAHAATREELERTKERGKWEEAAMRLRIMELESQLAAYREKLAQERVRSSAYVETNANRE